MPEQPEVHWGTTGPALPPREGKGCSALLWLYLCKKSVWLYSV